MKTNQHSQGIFKSIGTEVNIVNVTDNKRKKNTGEVVESYVLSRLNGKQRMK